MRVAPTFSPPRSPVAVYFQVAVPRREDKAFGVWSARHSKARIPSQRFADGIAGRYAQRQRSFFEVLYLSANIGTVLLLRDALRVARSRVTRRAELGLPNGREDDREPAGADDERSYSLGEVGMQARSVIRMLGAAAAAVLLLAVDATVAWADSTSELETIVVTARRREETLQTTPVSVTAFSTESLRDREITDLAKLSDYVPNFNLLTSTSFGGSSTAYAFIRGIGQLDLFVQNDPGVGIYLDGVYVGRSQGAVLDVVDLERVEVLRGPQGSLFGRNTVGGAVNLVTAPAGPSRAGYVEVEGGNYGTLNGKARINLPLSDNLFFSATLLRRGHDGYDKAKPSAPCPVCSHDALSNDDTWAGRVALRYVPSDSLTIDLGADFSDKHNRSIGSRLAFFGDTSNPQSIAAAYNNAVLTQWGVPAAAFVNLDSNTHQSSFTGWDYQRAWGTNLTIAWQLGGGTMFKSITAFRGLSVNDASDSDGTPMVNANLIGETTGQHQVSQEFQLIGASFDKKLDWTVGLFGMKENALNTIIQGQQFAEMQFIPPFSPPLFLPFPLFVPSMCFNKNAPPLFGCGLLDGTDGKQLTDYRVRTAAAYGNATWHITDRFSLSVGGRLNRDQKSFYYWNDAQGPLPANALNLDHSWNSFTPRVGLEFQVDKDILLYSSFSRGFKSGNFNSGNDPTQPLFVKPEKVEAYEVGAKTSWLDHRLTANLAVFYTEYKDQQLLVQTSFVQQERAYVNVAGSTIKGFEFELAARPTTHVQLNASVGNTESKVTSLALGTPSVGLGTRLVHTPVTQINVGAAIVDIPVLTTGRLGLRADWTHKTSQEGDYLNSQVAQVAGYDVANARLTYSPITGTWELYAYCNNLFDKKYEVARYSFLPSLVAGAVDGPPRTYVAGARVRF